MQVCQRTVFQFNVQNLKLRGIFLAHRMKRHQGHVFLMEWPGLCKFSFSLGTNSAGSSWLNCWFYKNGSHWAGQGGWLTIDLPFLSINSVIFSYPVPFWSFTHLISLFCFYMRYMCMYMIRCNIHLLGINIHGCVETRGGFQYLLLFLYLGFYWMWSSPVQLDWPANSNLFPSTHTSVPVFLMWILGIGLKSSGLCGQHVTGTHIPSPFALISSEHLCFSPPFWLSQSKISLIKPPILFYKNCQLNTLATYY